MEAIAKVKNQRGSAKKIRLVADLIRNKNVNEAKDILFYSKKGASELLLKLLNAAIANAVHKKSKVNTNELFINKIFVDEGPTMKRMKPRARGMADLMRRRTSHITVSVSDESNEDSTEEGSE
ncbi:MAG: 50S ribosomal protein L22 [Candidatus Cloacimonetes bacterium]|nr:50S ribosomal protein L22 [Candidatus Cloacimonadota bacterium]MBS3766919.1 50S ribosomal protein L22 [Candidatus Cloacimonadota bacterium]